MEYGAKILLVDDEIKVINSLKRVLKKDEYEILTATTSEEAIDILNNNKLDMIICDHNMPNMLGTDILKYSKKILPEAVRILITGSSDIDVAISAINEGSIYYYFRKPWKNEEITKVVARCLEYHREQEGQKALFEIMGYSREHLLGVADKLRTVSNFLLEPHIELSNTEQGGHFPKKKNERKNIKISIREDDNIILINTTEITYLTAGDGDVFVVTQKGKHRSTQSLNTWEKRLKESSFFRCHRSYIVNIDQIEKISPWFNGTYNLKLKNMKENIPVSRSCTKKLKEWFGL
ncbi:MAG: LytTR family transcriptional regulator DNA-binding domain-containing protein [Bacillota bacterium]